VRFVASAIQGVEIVEGVSHSDERGSFRRLWCRREFGPDAGTHADIVQASLSQNLRRGTLRGMHFQVAPSRESKLVQCVAGKIYDVALDLRPASKTYLSHFGLELAAHEPRALLIPPGCAHGFLTLTDHSAVVYMMTDYYEPKLSCGVRWNDPRFGIRWPSEPTEMLPRDAAYPDFDAALVQGFTAY
jgi:dTDP-4-dehydrorhamnose 3,5-epimerase